MYSVSRYVVTTYTNSMAITTLYAGHTYTLDTVSVSGHGWTALQSLCGIKHQLQHEASGASWEFLSGHDLLATWLSMVNFSIHVIIEYSV